MPFAGTFISKVKKKLLNKSKRLFLTFSCRTPPNINKILGVALSDQKPQLQGYPEGT